MHSVNYKDYLNLVLKGAGLCLFEVDVEKQRYVRFENAEAIYQVSGEKVLSDLEEFSSLTPDAYMKAVSDYFVHPDDHGTVADAFGKVLNGQQAVYDARMKCGTGKYHWCRICATPYMREDKLYLIGVVSDVSNLYDLILNDRASHSRYFSDELDAQFFC